jgi:hypothetical protein
MSTSWQKQENICSGVEIVEHSFFTFSIENMEITGHFLMRMKVVVIKTTVYSCSRKLTLNQYIARHI